MKKLLFIIIAVGLFSCKKDGNTETVTLSGTITISNPVEGDTLQCDSLFSVNAVISGNKVMHGHYVVIYNQNDQSVLYENQVHDHASSYALNETVTHHYTTVTPLRLVIEAAGDHEGELLTKEILFSVTP